jgi:hypothetical protein
MCTGFVPIFYKFGHVIVVGGINLPHERRGVPVPEVKIRNISGFLSDSTGEGNPEQLHLPCGSEPSE